MAFEQKEGQGVLWKNTRRENDSQPNARGEALIGGVLYEISAWTKRKGDGEPFQSLAIKPKARKDVRPTDAARDKDVDFDDALPF